MAKRGRPPELTEQLVQQVYDALRKTAFVETAAPLTGLSSRTVYRWIARGTREQRRIDRGLSPKESEALYLEFCRTIKKARAEVEEQNLAVIQGAGRAGEWTAAAWVCERLAPERWSNQKHELRALKRQLAEMAKQLQEIRDVKTPKT